MGNYGGEFRDINDAHDSDNSHNRSTGIDRSGRGPFFTQRVLPVLLPVLRSTLVDQGMRRRAMERDFTELARGVLLRTSASPDDDGQSPVATTHQEAGRFRFDIITRSRAYELLLPGGVRGYWAAAAHHGLRYWADNSVVVIHRGRASRGKLTDDGPVTTPVYRPLPRDASAVTPDPAFPDLQVVDAVTCAIQCLTTVITGKKSWWVPVVPGLTSRTVRAVQFLDAFFQCTRLTRDEVLAAGHGCIARRTLRQIVALTDPDYGAQSPMETVLRLIVRDVLPTGHRWQSQLQISTMDGTVLPEGYRGRCATPDLACPELKVALFYDGQHHDGTDQTDIDFDMFQELRDAGWEVIRINRVQLKNRAKTMKQIAGAVARGMTAHRTV